MNLIKVSKVIEITSLSRATIYAKIKAKDFPCAVKLGKRSVAWRLSDVNAWIATRPVAS